MMNLLPKVLLTLAIYPNALSYADTYVTTEGDTIVITNKPSSQQRRRARVINKTRPDHRGRRGQTCYLENRKTKEKTLATNPSKRLLKSSRVIWCEKSSENQFSRLDADNRKKMGRIKQKSSSQPRLKRREGGGRSLPKRAERFKDLVSEAALKYQLPEALLWAFMKVESDFIPSAVSRKGAQGLMQLMPLTAKDMGVTDPFNPKENIFGAARLISILMKRFNKEIPLVISAYHAGGGAVTRREGIPYSETSQYMTSVLNAYYRYMKNPPYLREKN